MSEILDLSLVEVAKKLQNREISALEATSACLERIEACEPVISALLAIDAERALATAKEMDAKGPDSNQPLWGVPFTIKDAISTKDITTTAASRILENYVPFYDAHVITCLKKAGAIIIAKANMDEFAMGSSTENSAFQKTRNPWDTAKTPGGSSGGSAASVAAKECYASLGSDTGGSIRQPAAFCGCCGLKPTYGRVSRYGLFAFGSSLDQIGPIARSVEDCAQVLDVIAGHDPRDNTSSAKPVENYLAAVRQYAPQQALKGITIGIPSKFFEEGLSAEVSACSQNAIKQLQEIGVAMLPIDLPDPQIAIAAYYIIAMAEASSNLARYDGIRYGRRAAGVTTLDELYVESRSQGFGQEVKRRVMLGSYVLSSGYYDAYFQKAAQTRRLIATQYLAALEKCDAFLMPVAPVTAWPLGSHEQNPLQAYLMDAFTLPVNLAGLPAISIPVGIGNETGMPVGLQIAGAPFKEAKILKIAHALEQNLPKIGQPKLF